MEIVVFHDGNPYAVDVDVLEVVRMMAAIAGFVDVDVEPFPGSVSITAYRSDGSVKCTVGRSREEAARSFIDDLDIASFGRRVG